ncbi:MAG: right-handed parallel beta-helix repeat-containing protein [Kiritimatiellaeota bacterium]|nr:right-handed parallel beta-helix repeat-containing protein [Kiritimatiellota bacterium]
MQLKTFVQLLISALCFASGALDAGVTVYVAPGGDDAWSGRLATATAAGTDGPFASLERARDALRAARAAGGQGPFVVEMRGGTYLLPRPLAFGPEDSGDETGRTVFRAFRGERPVISGGRRITGFRPGRINGAACWRAPVPGVRQGWYFHQLYVRRRGAKHFERRYRPTKGMLTVAGLTYSPARKAAAHRAAQRDFIFFEGDFREWRNLSDIEVVALHAWSASRLYIEKLDFKRNVVRFTSMPTFRIGHWYRGGRNPYWIENIREELRQPGQWYLDRSEGTLYYLPLPGETPENTEVIAPFLERLVVVAGDEKTGRLVERLRFEGLTFCHTAWAPPRSGYDVSQGQPTLPAAIEWTWARHCVMERCSVAHTGAYAVSFGRGCANDRIAGCLLHDLGGGGVKVGDSRMSRTAGPPELPVDNTVENNVIADGGIENFSANAVWAGIVRGLRVCHNEVRNFPYTGVAVGWSWGLAETSAADNAIEYNHIHRVMRLIEDGGGIYTLGRQPGTVIRGNVIHDIFEGPFACSEGQLGIYLDEGSGPFLVEQNLVYDVQFGGYNQHRARGNTVRNNIIAFVRQDPVTSARSHSPAYTFERNIVYLEQEDMLSRRHDPGKADTVFDWNLYWSASGKPPLFAGRTLGQWRATGRDVHSRVADPLFVDAVQRDFRLRKGSPAFELGIRPPDPAAAGLEAAFRDVDDPEAPVFDPPVYKMARRVLPPLKPGFKLDLEQVPIGVCPREFACAGRTPDKGEFVVTEEAAFRGKRSLKGFEKGGLSQPFYPYLIRSIRLGDRKKGRVVFAFAFRNGPEDPGLVNIEFRDYANRGDREFLSGPRMQFGPDGTVRVGRKPLGRIPNGVWCEVRMSFGFGPGTPRTFEVTVRVPSGQTASGLFRLPDAAFLAPTWLGIISYATGKAEFYLDDLSLEIGPRA